MSERNHYLLELEGFALELGHTAGGIANAYFRSSFSVDNKDAEGFDPVTSADHAIENVLRESIRESYPDHGIVAEESGNEAGQSKYTWYIDPIDGTRAFMMGSPLWGTLVGLAEKQTPLVGLLVQPFLGEVFLGSPSGSWLIRESGRNRLKSGTKNKLAAATLATTDPNLFSPECAPGFARISEACLLTRYGGDCYNYAMLAAGFVDLVVEDKLNPYDIVPLIPIITGAGGIVTDWQGGTAMAGGSIVAAANPALHQAALERLA